MQAFNLSIPDGPYPSRRVGVRPGRTRVSTSTGRHITGICLGAAVYKFAGAYFTGAEIEHARYLRSFSDADVLFAGAAR
jgi:hypothetical protein